MNHTEEHTSIPLTTRCLWFPGTKITGSPVRSHQKRLRDPDIAKDLTQETWLKALRGIQSFRGESAFYSWVYRIAPPVGHASPVFGYPILTISAVSVV